MIKYSLKCSNDHVFESWFESAGAYDKLHKAKMITCSVCGDTDVEKTLMAPQVTPGRKKADLTKPASPAEQAIKELRKKVEENSENVGANFATEARAMHYGDKPERAIYGQAKPDEAKSLIDEGVPVTPLPWGEKSTN
ncbi:MAG: DUF1178 family protein [Pseudomonadota bacterium]